MYKKNIPAVYGSNSRLLRRWILAAVLTMGLFAFCAAISPAQNIPLNDLVPLQDLEVRTTDLIRLVEAYSDGLRDLKVAQLNLEALTTLSASTVVSQLEIRIAKLNVQTAERKVTIFRVIAEKELAATQAKIGILEQMEKVGEKADKTEKPVAAAPTSQNRVRIAQARAVANILQMILEMK
jgi:hypothetical protein